VRLTSEGTLTPASQVDATELQRRQLLETTKFLIRVKINGKCVTETDPYAVSHPALTVDVRRFFEFRVLHQPSSVYVLLLSSLSYGLCALESPGPLLSHPTISRA